MAYNMKRGNKGVPFSELGSSPAKQQVPLSEGEIKKGAEITGGDSQSGVITDLEDRIEFLENDIKEEDQEGPTKNRAQLEKLRSALSEARKGN